MFLVQNISKNASSARPLNTLQVVKNSIHKLSSDFDN